MYSCIRIFSVLYLQEDIHCTFGQVDLQRGISHPEEFGCPPLVVWGYSHTPKGSQQSQLHVGTEYQTQGVLHPEQREKKRLKTQDCTHSAILSQLTNRFKQRLHITYRLQGNSCQRQLVLSVNTVPLDPVGNLLQHLKPTKTKKTKVIITLIQTNKNIHSAQL